MYIKTEDFKEKILDAYVAGESNTHKNAQDYYRKWFLTKVRFVKEPPNQEVAGRQKTYTFDCPCGWLHLQVTPGFKCKCGNVFSD